MLRNLLTQHRDRVRRHIEKRNELKRKIPPQNLHTINKEITDQYENAKRRRTNTSRASNTQRTPNTPRTPNAPRTPHTPRTPHVGKVKDIINGKVRVRCLKEDYGSVLDAAEYERENDAVFYDRVWKPK